MKIVVVGGTGLIGSKLVSKLLRSSHEVVIASPTAGVNTLTGEGLAAAVTGAAAVVDVSNSPSFDGGAAYDYFTTSTRNLLAEEAAAGVTHHIALSVVGAERLTDSGYFRAKVAQEQLIKLSSVPYTMVHSTQTFEFVKTISEHALDAQAVRLAPALVEPVATDDVATALTALSQEQPRDGMLEITGPQRFRLEQFVRHGLIAAGDPRVVVADPDARYFGARLGWQTLLPSAPARRGGTHFRDWLTARRPRRPLRLHHELQSRQTAMAQQATSSPMLAG